MAVKNLLILSSDEHRADMMGAAGHALARTSNLDALAERGIRFTNAYTPSPICVPARASLATGRYAHETGYWDNAMAYDGQVRSWGHALRDVGVTATSIGKLHYRRADDDTGFSRQINPMHVLNGIGMVWGSIRNPLPDLPRMNQMLAPVGQGLSSYNAYDIAVAEEAEAWLSDAPEEPWCLFTSFVAPHFPLTAPQEFWDLYPQVDLPELRVESGYEIHPWLARMHAFMPHDDILRTDAARREAIRGYLALTSFMDAQIGRVIAALEASGKMEDTLILYLSDHGECLGNRNAWGKSVLYGDATRIPLLMAGPGIAPGMCETAVNLVDVAETVANIFGTTLDGPGEDLRDIARAPADRGRVSFSEYHAVGSPSGGFMVANADWAYHFYAGYAPELFDLREDPGQASNLAGKAEYAGKEAEMHAALLAICDPVHTDRRAKADQDALIARLGGADAAMKIGPVGATPAPS